MTGDQLAAAASGLSGCRFRLHGRNPETGLDCIGLLQAAMVAAGGKLLLPNGYTLRQRKAPDLAGIARSMGFQPVGIGTIRAGDVIVLRPSVCQVHLALAIDDRHVVHAHAGLGKAVISPAPLPWPVLSQWRLDSAPVS